MRLHDLASAGQGVVDATVILEDDQRTQVRFTTDYASGIDLANPEPNLFMTAPVSIEEETRRIVSAVVPSTGLPGAKRNPLIGHERADSGCSGWPLRGFPFDITVRRSVHFASPAPPMITTGSPRFRLSVEAPLTALSGRRML